VQLFESILPRILAIKAAWDLKEPDNTHRSESGLP
jgi:hypothetical protein